MGTFGFAERAAKTCPGQRVLKKWPGVFHPKDATYDAVAEVFSHSGFAVARPPMQCLIERGKPARYRFRLLIAGKTSEGLRWLIDYFRGKTGRLHIPPVPKNPITGEDIYAVWWVDNVRAGLLADELIDRAKTARDRHIFRSIARVTMPQPTGRGKDYVVPESVLKFRESTTNDLNLLCSDWPIGQLPRLYNRSGILEDIERQVDRKNNI